LSLAVHSMVHQDPASNIGPKHQAGTADLQSVNG